MPRRLCAQLVKPAGSARRRVTGNTLSYLLHKKAAAGLSSTQLYQGDSTEVYRETSRISISSSAVPMKHFTAQTLVLIAVIRLASVPLRFGRPGGPSGFGLPQKLSFPGHQQRQQSSTKQSTGLTYLLDEENAGYFRGEW